MTSCYNDDCHNNNGNNKNVGGDSKNDNDSDDDDSKDKVITVCENNDLNDYDETMVVTIVMATGYLSTLFLQDFIL